MVLTMLYFTAVHYRCPCLYALIRTVYFCVYCTKSISHITACDVEAYGHCICTAADYSLCGETNLH